MNENQVHHMDFLKNELPDKCANLIIADPPYFEVKGHFDFIWKTFDDYLQDVEKWAKECRRIITDNGTLFWYGHAKKIAYTQVIIDRYLNLENNIAIEFNRQTKRSVKDFRCFAPVSERLLMYSTEVDKTGLQQVHDSPECFQDLKKYMRQERDALMARKGFKTIDQFNKFINDWTNTNSVVSRHYFADSQYCFPTKEIYTRMQETGLWKENWDWLRSIYDANVEEYTHIQQAHEATRRPFDNYLGLYDIMKFDQESHNTRKYAHDTVKPEKLSRALILTCSRPGDLVVVPFAGSGTECAMSIKEGRRAVGFDLEQKNCEMANKRIDLIAQAPSLFQSQ